MSTTTEPIATIPPALPGELKMAALDELHESPKNPRTYFAPGPLAELAESIKASGVRVPLIVRARLEGGGYEIGAGHRRFRAAKLAGVSHVPVLARDMSDVEFQKVLSFDNLQREDVQEMAFYAGAYCFYRESTEMQLRSTHEDANRAADEWGANCGPGAIAAICGLTLQELRPHMGDFEGKGYANPTLMWQVLRNLGVRFKVYARPPFGPEIDRSSLPKRASEAAA